MAEETINVKNVLLVSLHQCIAEADAELGETYVKSPVASGTFACSSVKNLVKVIMSVLMFSWPTGGAPPGFAILQ